MSLKHFAEASRIATDRTEPEHVKKQGTVHPADDANVGSMSCQASSSTSAFSSVLVDGSSKFLASPHA